MKRCKNKRKLAVLGLAAAMALSLAACGEKRPSQEDVEQSIEAGTLTIEDALDKGWVDQAWVDAYYEENSVPAASKTESNMVGDFATTTLSGEAFTREQLGDVVFFAFLDPEAEGTQVFYNALAEGYGGVAENGAEILVCTKSGTGSEMFADAPFPVILYNDSLAAAVGSNRSMVEDGEMPNVASWYVNGTFLSAWYSAVDAEELPASAAAFVEMSRNAAFQSGTAVRQTFSEGDCDFIALIRPCGNNHGNSGNRLCYCFAHLSIQPEFYRNHFRPLLIPSIKS